jgi:hypothetical protein
MKLLLFYTFILLHYFHDFFFKLCNAIYDNYFNYTEQSCSSTYEHDCTVYYRNNKSNNIELFFLIPPEAIQITIPPLYIKTES